MRKNVLFLSCCLWLLFTLSACGNKLPIETNMSEKVADFTAINQDEETVHFADLTGQWWIADFIFTNCTTVCLPMTSNMSTLQDLVAAENLAVQFVSFSVDPERDTPNVLKQYGEQHGADFTNWHFLTGYDFPTIKELSIKSFRALLKEPEPGSDQFTHDTRFFLVDPNGKIVKGYNGVQRDNLEEIVADLQMLAEEGLLQPFQINE